MLRMLIVVATTALAVGCGKPPAQTETKDDVPSAKAPDVTPAGPARDYAEYVAELRKTVPLRVDEFKAKGLKCDPYVTSNLAGIEIFDSLTLTIDPVILKDSLTGKAQKYVGARMVRAGNGDVFATGSSPDAEASRKNGGMPIAWDSVAMVPAAK